MNPEFMQKGKCIICYKKSLQCRRFLFDAIAKKCIYQITGKLIVDLEKLSRCDESKRLICSNCFQEFSESYYFVEELFCKNLTSNSSVEMFARLSPGTKKTTCVICKKSCKYLKALESSLISDKRHIFKHHFEIDIHVLDNEYRNACLTCYNYIQFLCTFYRTFYCFDEDVQIITSIKEKYKETSLKDVQSTNFVSLKSSKRIHFSFDLDKLDQSDQIDQSMENDSDTDDLAKDGTDSIINEVDNTEKLVKKQNAFVKFIRRIFRFK